MKDDSKKSTKPINMDIDVEVWKKVGILSAVNGMTKRSVVETAINQYFEKEAEQHVE